MKEFEDLIDELNGQGLFQKRLLYVVLGPLFFFLPLSWLNEIFLLHVPNHWCYHPSQEGLNSTEMDVWKSCFLPLEKSAEGGLEPSGCKIYMPKIYEDEDKFWQDSNLGLTHTFANGGCPVNSTQDEAAEIKIIKCKSGWVFDKSEFTSTVPTEQNWVCDNSEYVPDLFTYGVVGSILGTIVFSYLGDILGRRYIFWITTAIVIIFMAAKTFLADYYAAYLIFKLIAASSYVASYQLPFTLITEITDAAYRSWCVGITCILWTVGLCFLPLVGWLAKDWKIISLATVLPLATAFLGWKYVPESPRWQLTRGLRDKAAVTIREIARVNKKPIPVDLEKRLDELILLMKREESANLGYISLFSSKGLILKTFNVTIALVASNFIYYQLMLNIGNMSGSIFINFFLLSVIEAPGYYLGIWISDKFGRRWSHTGLLLVNTLCLFLNCFISIIPDFSVGVLVCCLIAKSISSATFLIVYVQTVEIYPTCIRNTGMGFTSLLGMVIGIAGPYVVHLGQYDVRYPYAIMCLITFAGAISASFLPETIGAALPETIEEASVFGKDQKFFSWIRKPSEQKSTSSSQDLKPTSKTLSEEKMAETIA